MCGEGLTESMLVGLKFSGLLWSLMPFSRDWNFLEKHPFSPLWRKGCRLFAAPSELLA